MWNHDKQITWKMHMKQRSPKTTTPLSAGFGLGHVKYVFYNDQPFLASKVKPKTLPMFWSLTFLQPSHFREASGNSTSFTLLLFADKHLPQRVFKQLDMLRKLILLLLPPLLLLLLLLLLTPTATPIATTPTTSSTTNTSGTTTIPTSTFTLPLATATATANCASYSTLTPTPTPLPTTPTPTTNTTTSNSTSKVQMIFSPEPCLSSSKGWGVSCIEIEPWWPAWSRIGYSVCFASQKTWKFLISAKKNFQQFRTSKKTWWVFHPPPVGRCPPSWPTKYFRSWPKIWFFHIFSSFFVRSFQGESDRNSELTRARLQRHLLLNSWNTSRNDIP